MKIRKAVLNDAYGIAKVHVDSWHTTYSNIIPDECLNKLTYESRQKLWERNIVEFDVFVAENNEREIIGFEITFLVGTINREMYITKIKVS